MSGFCISSIRSPGPVAPHDVHCESFHTTYTRIATDDPIPHPHSSHTHSTQQQKYHQQHNHHLKSDLDRKVDDSIETFLRTLSPIGPELMAGRLTINFFERRGKQKLFGLVHQEEKIVWEQWVLRVVVNNTPRPMGEDEASVIERQRIQVREAWFIIVGGVVLYCCVVYQGRLIEDEIMSMTRTYCELGKT